MSSVPRRRLAADEVSIQTERRRQADDVLVVRPLAVALEELGVLVQASEVVLHERSEPPRVPLSLGAEDPLDQRSQAARGVVDDMSQLFELAMNITDDMNGALLQSKDAVQMGDLSQRRADRREALRSPAA